eukprot:IDg7169t1
MQIRAARTAKLRRRGEYIETKERQKSALLCAYCARMRANETSLVCLCAHAYRTLAPTVCALARFARLRNQQRLHGSAPFHIASDAAHCAVRAALVASLAEMHACSRVKAHARVSI